MDVMLIASAIGRVNCRDRASSSEQKDIFTSLKSRCIMPWPKKLLMDCTLLDLDLLRGIATLLELAADVLVDDAFDDTDTSVMLHMQIARSTIVIARGVIMTTMTLQLCVHCTVL